MSLSQPPNLFFFFGHQRDDLIKEKGLIVGEEGTHCGDQDHDDDSVIDLLDQGWVGVVGGSRLREWTTGEGTNVMDRGTQDRIL